MNILQCDGCPANEAIAVGELHGKKIKRVAVAVIWPGVTDTSTNSYDLCENCRNTAAGNGRSENMEHAEARRGGGLTRTAKLSGLAGLFCILCE